MAETATDPVLSLQAGTGSEGLTLEGLLSSGCQEDTMVEHLALRTAIATLDSKEQQILNLRYFHALTQMQTAKILGVSQVQVSRLERRAIETLRHKLLE